MLRTLTIAAAFMGVAALTMALAACSNESNIEATSPTPVPTPSPQVEVPVEGASATASSGASSSASSGESKGDDSGNGNGGNGNGNGDANGQAGASQSSSSDGVASFANPNPDGNGITLNSAPNEALKDAKPLDIVTWNKPPTLSMWELYAEGEIQNGGVLFDPTQGEGSAFSLYYKGHDESLVELLPDLGPMMMWLTDLTVAPTEWEVEGGKFSFRAYSPLFMDSDPSNLELRVYGYDGDGDPAVLAIADIVAE